MVTSGRGAYQNGFEAGKRFSEPFSGKVALAAVLAAAATIFAKHQTDVAPMEMRGKAWALSY